MAKSLKKKRWKWKLYMSKNFMRKETLLIISRSKAKFQMFILGFIKMEKD
jgi:hypothetical protein